MYQLIKEGTFSNIPVQDFVCDKKIDIYNLPKSPLGSTCFCLEDKSAWVKGSDEWKEITSPTSSNEELEILEQLIDQSGVLESTDGTVTEKVEELIDCAELEKWARQFDISVPTSGRQKMTYIPKTRAFSSRESLENAFSSCPYLVVVFGLDISSVTNTKSMFSSDQMLETVVLENTGNVTGWYRAFYKCYNLKSVKTLDFSSATYIDDMFWGCGSLEEVRFVPETIKVSISFVYCSLLTAESIQSIVDGLATVTTAQTLTLPANLKILQSQVDSANAKGWTVAGGTVVSEEEYYG